MIFEADFLYAGQPRWNLGWATPNYAGAFLVTLVVLGWVLSPRARGWCGWWLLGLGAEGALYFLLAKTYSRGAWVALGCAAVYFIAVMGFAQLKQTWRIWMMRLVLCVGCVVGTGLVARLSPGYMGGDGATLNRLELWRGGLRMCAAAPLQGWGAGESGRAYMNWFQDVDRSEGYTTMVNSYLHVGVEQGLPTLAGVMGVLFVLLALSWWLTRNDRGFGAGRETMVGGGKRADGALGITRPALLAAVGASLVAWSVANAFTTLWIEPKLWFVPGLAVLIILGAAVQVRLTPALWVWVCRSGLVGAGVMAGMVWMAGVWLSAGDSLVVCPQAKGAISVQSKGKRAETETVWHVWPDSAVLGPTPGKEQRRWVEASAVPLSLLVHRADEAESVEGSIGAGPHGMVLFGRQVERLAQSGVENFKRVWLVHPLGAPPRRAIKVPGEARLVLPTVDEAGNGPAWRAWAKAVGARMVESPAVGLDIRAAWPRVVVEGTR